MWKVGLVGTGFWSEKHLLAWQRIPNVQIAALCNRSKEKLLHRAEAFGVPEQACFLHLEEMLEQADIDIVDIVTGPETHLEFVQKAAAAGKHIMCQKPFATSLEEAKQMVEFARMAGVRLMVTENWRWLEPFQIIKRVLESGALGTLLTARYTHSDFYTMRMEPDRALPQPFFRDMPRLIFYEMGAHWFDTWRYLFGHPSRLYAETRRLSPYIVGEDSGVVILGYDRFYGTLDMSWATRRELRGPLEDTIKAHNLESLLIEGDNASLRYDVTGKIVLIDHRGVETIVASTTELDHAESHYRLQTHFIQCLDTGDEFQTSGEDNLRTLELIFSTYESAAEHKAIIFDAHCERTIKE